jgi:hypothetical protein
VRFDKFGRGQKGFRSKIAGSPEQAVLPIRGLKESLMSIFFIPKKRETGTMWDTWLYWHEGSYYLYYLAKSGPTWDNISLAISPDGLQWNEVGPILSMGKGVTWQ